MKKCRQTGDFISTQCYSWKKITETHPIWHHMLPSLPSCTQRDGHLLTPMLTVLQDSYNFSFSSSSETSSYLYPLPKPSFPPTFLLYFILAPRTDISLRQISTAAPSICSIYPCLDRVLSSHFLWLLFPPPLPLPTHPPTTSHFPSSFNTVHLPVWLV